MTPEGYLTIRPLKNQVLLGPLPRPGLSPGGIHLLDSDRAGQMDYYVVAIGPKVENVAAGDKVVTPLYFDHLTLEDGTGRKLVDAKQILGVWKEEEFVPTP